MSNFTDSHNFKTHDDYYTRSNAWELIKNIIPKDKVIWEACMLGATQSKSPHYLTEMGFEVVYDTTWDIFTENRGDIIVTNIPFETNLKQMILKRLVELDKPFIIIMNSLNIFSKYFPAILDPKYIQLIIPSKKLNYDKLENDVLTDGKGCCSFYSIFIAYKMNIPQDKLFV